MRSCEIAANRVRGSSPSFPELATTSTTVTQDFGDPDNVGFGYIDLSLDDLPAPAKRLTLESIFVRSSFEFVDAIDFGVSSIAYTHWGT